MVFYQKEVIQNILINPQKLLNKVKKTISDYKFQQCEFFHQNKVQQIRLYLNSTCMKSTNHQCVNCQLHFEVQADYMTHYKSEHHRYNIKRKLIGLPPLSFEQYHLQFDDEKTSKQSAAQDFYCQICSKKFMNAGTYKQHLASNKHKQNRVELKSPNQMTLSKSSSSSDFQIIGAERVQICLFCQSQGTSNHMKLQHCFPPFEHECVNYQGLVSYLREKISKFECVYCHLKFNSQESTRQHMKDTSHGKLNIGNFRQYEKFYLWKIQQSSSQSQDQQLRNDNQNEPHNDDKSVFEELEHPTLDDLQKKRLDRIQLTATGAIINGKQVGYRHLKKYYKQYLNREIINFRQKYQPALQMDKSNWQIAVNHCKTAKISQNVNTR